MYFSSRNETSYDFTNNLKILFTCCPLKTFGRKDKLRCDDISTMFKLCTASTKTKQYFKINCKRNKSFDKKSLPYHCFTKFNEYRRLLIEILWIKNREAEKILRHQESIFYIPKSQLVNQCRLCMKANVDMRFLSEDIGCLRLPQHQLENRIFLLKEMGASYISSAMLSNFTGLMGINMGLFKAYTNISTSVNVAENLLSCVGLVPDHVLPAERLDDQLTVQSVNIRCLISYLAWLFNIPKEDKVLRNLASTSKYRSFVLLQDYFTFLYEDIGLRTNQIIERHTSVNHGSVTDLRRIVKDVKTYADIEIKELIRQKPIFHRLQYQNVIEVIALLEKHGFSNPVMAYTPEILLLPAEEVAWRLDNFEKSPNLRILKKNEKSLKMILSFNETEKRLGYFNYMNINDFTVYSLTSGRSSFERFMKNGTDRTKGKEIVSCFTGLLKLDSKEIERRFRKHPYWKHVDLNSMNETLEFLLPRFSVNDLQDNVQILLYPRKKIEEALNELSQVNEGEKEKGLVHSGSQILALILYEIERECGFTGDGIWKDDALLQGQRDENVKHTDDELSDLSDSDLSDSDLSECDDINKQIKG